MKIDQRKLSEILGSEIINPESAGLEGPCEIVRWICFERNDREDRDTWSTAETQLIMSPEEYHKLPGISNSKLSVFIEDPREYYYQFLSGEYVEKPKDHFDFGSAVHQICLLGSQANIVVIPREVLASNGARSGNAWKQFAAEHEGMLLLKLEDFNAVMRCFQAINSHPIAGELLAAPGDAERVFISTEGGMIRRCRPDKICQWQGKTIVVDLKTTTSTLPQKFVKSIDQFGYARQEVFYRKVLADNDVFVDAFIFIAVKDSQPHCVDCYQISREWIEMAEQEVAAAEAELYRRHRENDWGVVTANSIVELAPPNSLKFKGDYSL